MVGSDHHQLPQIIVRNCLVVVVAVFAVGVYRAPAFAGPDPGPSIPAVAACSASINPLSVPVARIGNHLVRCDYLVR